MQNTETILITFTIIIVYTIFLFGFIVTMGYRPLKKRNWLLQNRLEAQEDTLRHVTREIHDNIGQHLTVAKFSLQAITAISAPDQIHFNRTDQSLSLMMEGVRNLVGKLNADLITQNGFLPAVKWLLSSIASAGIITVTLKLTGDALPTGRETELSLYRIFQEMMSNIIKHAKATSVIVELTTKPGLFILSVQDNGIGFTAAILNPSDYGTSTGIANMQERAKLLKGRFELISKPGEGTTVAIHIPLNK